MNNNKCCRCGVSEFSPVPSRFCCACERVINHINIGGMSARDAELLELSGFVHKSPSGVYFNRMRYIKHDVFNDKETDPFW